MPTMTQPVAQPQRQAQRRAQFESQFESRPVLGAGRVTGGVDTHKDTHTAAVLDPTGRLLGHRQFPTTPAG